VMKGASGRWPVGWTRALAVAAVVDGAFWAAFAGAATAARTMAAASHKPAREMTSRQLVPWAWERGDMDDLVSGAR
jgi:hypothetical protein